MEFWIFMVIMALLIPFTMLGFGKYFVKKAPKEINCLLGYRTSRSMKNKETWKFAHHHCGKVWIKCGWIMILISIVVMFFAVGKNEEAIKSIAESLTMIQCVCLVGSLFPTEHALKKKFDKNGILK